jgi:hypothetical protein
MPDLVMVRVLPIARERNALAQMIAGRTCRLRRRAGTPSQA